MVKNLPTNSGDVGDAGSIPGSGRSHREENGNPLQCSYVENPWTEEPDGLQFMGSQRVSQNRASMHKDYWKGI